MVRDVEFFVFLFFLKKKARRAALYLSHDAVHQAVDDDAARRPPLGRARRERREPRRRGQCQPARHPVLRHPRVGRQGACARPVQDRSRPQALGRTCVGTAQDSALRVRGSARGRFTVEQIARRMRPAPAVSEDGRGIESPTACGGQGRRSAGARRSVAVADGVACACTQPSSAYRGPRGSPVEAPTSERFLKPRFLRVCRSPSSSTVRLTTSSTARCAGPRVPTAASGPAKVFLLSPPPSHCPHRLYAPARVSQDAHAPNTDLGGRTAVVHVLGRRCGRAGRGGVVV